MIYFLAPKDLCGIEPFVEGWRQSDYPEIGILAFEDVFMSTHLPAGTWVFMGVRQLPAAGKRLAEAVWEALTSAGQRVLNRPGALVSRLGLHQLLHSAGINEFCAYHPNEIDRIRRYPVFVRMAEEHTGSMSPLLSNMNELKSFLRWQQMRGFRKHDLIVVEFCDTANSAGEYRKYSVHCIDGNLAAQYLHVDLQWMVKLHGSEVREEWIREERDFVQSNPHREEIRKIFEMAHIDFGRIDYGLLGDKLQVWEINTNPSIGGPPKQRNVPRLPSDVRKLQRHARLAFYERLEAILRKIDSRVTPGDTIEWESSEEDRISWLKETQNWNRRHRRRENLQKFTEFPPIKRALGTAKKMLGVRIR